MEVHNMFEERTPRGWDLVYNTGKVGWHQPTESFEYVKNSGFVQWELGKHQHFLRTPLLCPRSKREH